MSKSIRSLIRPPSLKEGDVVGVVAPAGPVDQGQLESGLEVIRKMGFIPLLGRHIHSRSRYMAGSDEERARDFMAMFRNPKVRAIFCARGGYGANRILSYLNREEIRANPKAVVGSSDITMLLHFLVQECRLVAFHGPMIAGSFGRAKMKKSCSQFKALLTGNPKGKTFYSSGAKVFSKGVAQGKITGGCLTLLCRSLKTPYEINTRNKILLIEDVNEPLYRIDGMLWQLANAGIFKGVRGIIFGEMVNCLPQRKGDGKLEDVLADLFPKPGIPVLTHCPIGHGKEIWTLPFETSATLDSESKTLELKHCGVKQISPA